MNAFLHRPVLVKEAVSFLVTDPEGVYVDGTVGSGGHSDALIKALKPSARLICLDKDPSALSVAAARLGSTAVSLEFYKSDFAQMDELPSVRQAGRLDGILLDLGMSSNQLEESGRGFSFLRDEPLDMRMDPDTSLTAADLLNGLSASELERLLRLYGEERRARSIAKAVCWLRKESPFRTSRDFAAVVEEVVGFNKRGIHPATKSFQALRIAVNNELESLALFLEKAPDLLRVGGRLVIIAYHSLEDRIVKSKFAQWENPCRCPKGLASCTCGKSRVFKRVTKKAVRPVSAEVFENKRARSALLRVAERVDQ